jgi:hypothetical protein
VESTTSTEHHYLKTTFYICHIGEWNVQPLYHRKIITPLPEMTSIDNSSAAKFLALFCIPALLLASGSFDVSSSVIV